MDAVNTMHLSGGHLMKIFIDLMFMFKNINQTATDMLIAWTQISGNKSVFFFNMHSKNHYIIDHLIKIAKHLV
jgi:hypothetical protein